MVYENCNLFPLHPDTPSAVFRQRETTETTRPISQHKQPPKRPVPTSHALSTRSELALSIKEAANIATDVGDAAGTEELRGFTSEIEQSMEKLTQLQSKAAVGPVALLLVIFSDLSYDWLQAAAHS